MASKLSGLRKIWLFRNHTNFTFGTLAACATGYFIYTIKNESDLRSPVVIESVNLLGRNSEIRQLIGSPLTFKGVAADVTEDDSYFLYHISGPKGTLKAETTAKSRVMEEVYTPKEITALDQRINRLKGEEQQAVKRLEELRQQAIMKTDHKVKDNVKKEVDNQEVVVKNFQNELKEAVEHRSKLLGKLLTKYYIPDKKYRQIMEENKQSEETIPLDWKMWSIHNLQVTMPNGTKLILIPQPQQAQTKKPQPVTDVSHTAWNFKNLNQKLSIQPQDIQNLSQQQLNRYSQIRTQQMYSSLSYRRVSSFLLLGLIGMGSYVFYRKSKMISINNSVLVQTVQSMFSRHPEIRHFGRFNWSTIVKGGRKDTDVIAEIDVDSPRVKGVVMFEAKYDKKSDQYTITNARFVTKEDKPRIYDLLKP